MSISSLHRRPRRARLALAILILAATFPDVAARAQDATPRLELRSVSSLVKARRPKGAPVFLDLGVYVGAVDGPFEIWLTRPDYSRPVVVQKAVYAADGTRSLVDLPGDSVEEWFGFKDFMRIDVSQNGELVKSKTVMFCPNSYDRQRINDAGSDTPRYPEGCYGNPFTRGLVWGIDEGWAVNPLSTFGTSMRLKDGLYDVTVSIEPMYRGLFNVTEEAGSYDMQLKVRTVKGFPGCPECPVPHHPGGHLARREPMALPDVTDPDPATLPDLQALPSWGISVFKEQGRDVIAFGANVWVGGGQSLVVEGFRREGEAVMDAYQYFYENGEPVGRSQVGTLEYDPQRGHKHWHFLQFARYSLLDSTQTEVVLSKKEAFCLAPTDAIDLTLPDAEWTPYLGGLSTQCGGQNAMWVREVLPLGWGDTYFQGLPGQSFDITDLPNGTYYIEVEANPLGTLFEQTMANNSSLREVIISGKPGHRRVEVPPWNGIDTEGPIFGGG